MYDQFTCTFIKLSLLKEQFLSLMNIAEYSFQL